MEFKQPAVKVEVNAIYSVTVWREEVSYKEFGDQIKELYEAVKGNMPENFLLVYEDENGEMIMKTLKYLGENEMLLDARAVAAVGACVFLRSNDIDSAIIRKIYCLGDKMPSEILAGRGDIFAKDSSGSSRIKCIRIPELVKELLK